MSVTLQNILNDAMLLPADSRTELVEAILERTSPSEEFVTRHLGIITQRMKNVKEGTSPLIPAELAHRQVLESLKIPA